MNGEIEVRDHMISSMFMRRAIDMQPRRSASSGMSRCASSGKEHGSFTCPGVVCDTGLIWPANGAGTGELPLHIEDDNDVEDDCVSDSVDVLSSDGRKKSESH